MKKNIFIIGAAFLAITTISCSDDDDNGSSPVDAGSSDPVSVTFYNDPQELSPDRDSPDRLSLDSPGEFFEIEFQASEGNLLNFVSMSSISNDWLFAPGGAGIALFDADGSAITGDVTDQVYLWDAGTEEENPETFGGNGTDLREDDDDNTVRILEEDVSEYIMVDITDFDAASSTFTLRIYNLRGEFADPDPIRVSPGVLLIHEAAGANPFFTAGEPQRGNGLQLLAERGDFSELEDFFVQ